MTDNTNNDELAALKARVAELERAKPPPAPSEADVARYRDEMLSQIPPWLRAACAGGVSDTDAKDLVRASHRPQGPSTQSPQDFKEGRSAPAWRRYGRRS